MTNNGQVRTHQGQKDEIPLSTNHPATQSSSGLCAKPADRQYRKTVKNYSRLGTPTRDPPVELVKENTVKTAKPTAQPLSVKSLQRRADKWVVTLKNRKTDER